MDERITTALAAFGVPVSQMGSESIVEHLGLDSLDRYEFCEMVGLAPEEVHGRMTLAQLEAVLYQRDATIR